MKDRARVLELIYEAIDEVNLQLAGDRRIAKSEETILVGAADSLESLAFLNLIVAAEERIAEAFGVALPLASSLMESEMDRLPRTVAELADVICRRLKDSRDE